MTLHFPDNGTPFVVTRKGKKLTLARYLAFLNMAFARGADFACEHCHFGCAAWEGGPCGDEVHAALHAGKPEGFECNFC
jgi:hypothetical protein